MTSVSIQPKSSGNSSSNTKTASAVATTVTTTIASKPVDPTTTQDPSSSQVDTHSLKFRQEKERDDFARRLIEFHRHKNVNTPLISWPTLNGRAIDLQKLYNKVVTLGGWENVCEKDKWNEVGVYLDKTYLNACTNGAHALRLIYIRYLSLFEKFNHSLITGNGGYTNMTSLLSDQVMFNSALNSFSAGTSGSGMLDRQQQMLNSSLMINSASLSKAALDDKADDIALTSRRKFSYLIDSTSMNYNYTQHHSASNNDSSNNSTKLTFNPYEKLEISLISGLPNEIDFVFNTILLLSSDEFHAFRIYSSPRLLDLMLAHVGFFGSHETFDSQNNQNNYRSLYDNVWNNPADSKTGERRNFVKFWHNAINLPSSNESNTYPNDCDEEFGCPDASKLVTNLLPTLYNKYLKTLPSQELLNLHGTNNANQSKLTNRTTCNSVEYRRIEQVMITLNNLSFEENNADFMANKSTTLIEFLIMCIYCSNSFVELKRHALDILVNLSRKIKLKSMNDKLKRLFIMSICHLIVGNVTSVIQPEADDSSSEIKENYVDNGQDRMDILKGLEILTKLFSQQIDPQLDSKDYGNESLLSTYYLNEMTGVLFLNKILIRIEQLLTMQDVFILVHSLECLYHMSQFNEAICHLVVSYSGSGLMPRIVSMLVKFLTVDMTHFGLQSDDKQNNKSSQNMKLYKVGLINGKISNHQTPSSININNNSNNNIPLQTIVSSSNNVNNNSQNINQRQQFNHNNNNSSNNSNNFSLLQQTLNNQHQLNSTSNINSNSNSGNTVSALLNNNNAKISSSSSPSPNLQTQQVNQIMNSTNKASSIGEQQAKNSLCNWLRTCFQVDSTSEISKTKLYPYYQQIAKINNWTVLTIPTFFEILNATFPSLRYNDATNQIQGIKLIVNVKQQLLLKKDELIQQAENEVATWPVLPQNNNQVKVNSNTTQVINTSKPTNSKPLLNGHATADSETVKNNSLPADKIPAPLTNINVTTPSIMPLLTPPTPPPHSTTQTDENQNNNSLPNGSLSNSISNSVKQTSKLLNDTSNVKIESNEQQSVSLSENNKKYEKKIECEIQNTNEDPIINNIERRIAINNENSLKQTNGLNEHKLTNGNLSCDEVKLTNGTSKHLPALTNGHANNINNPSSVSSSASESSSENEDDEEMEDDGQIESFRKRKNDTSTSKRLSEANEEASSLNDSNNSPAKKLKPKLEEKEVAAVASTVENQVEEEATSAKLVNSESSLKPNHVNSTTVNNSITVATSNTTSTTPTPPASNPATTTATIQNPSSLLSNQGGDYVCEWNNCKLTFNSAKSIYNHVCKYHLLNTETMLNSCQNSNANSSGSLCLWLGCDQIRRQKWALVNHIQERHCNENALRCAVMYRQRGLVPVSTNASNTLSTTGGAITINYAKDAAFLAIQKNQRKSIEEFMSVDEGPISKSIRLLSALTLRNLARNSDKAKSIIRSHESVLTEIAFDLLESSNALANCLWHLTN